MDGWEGVRLDLRDWAETGLRWSLGWDRAEGGSGVDVSSCL